MKKELVETAREYAIRCHTEAGQMYGDMPYAVHLRDVFNWGRRYADLLRLHEVENVLAACWCHDIIEDARQTYNDVKNTLNLEVAEIVYAVTNEKGRTRKDRANDKYYAGIRQTNGAVFVKLCDRLANVDNANSSMLQMYRKEHAHFVDQIHTQAYQPIFDKLEELLKPKA